MSTEKIQISDGVDVAVVPPAIINTIQPQGPVRSYAHTNVPGKKYWHHVADDTTLSVGGEIATVIEDFKSYGCVWVESFTVTIFCNKAAGTIAFALCGKEDVPTTIQEFLVMDNVTVLSPNSANKGMLIPYKLVVPAGCSQQILPYSSQYMPLCFVARCTADADFSLIFRVKFSCDNVGFESSF